VGIFKRQQAKPTEQSTPRAAVSVGDDDLATCAVVLGEMEAALLGGDDAAIRLAARQIAWAGGIQPPDDLLRWVLEIKMSDPEAKPLDSPWHWLVAVAREATARQDYRLAGRVGFFLHGWNEHIAPKMGMADEADCGGIRRIPRELYVAGLGHALCGLEALDANDLVVTTSEKAVPVGALRPALAKTLLQLKVDGAAIDPRAREVALRASA
jgi:hypothetical protein